MKLRLACTSQGIADVAVAVSASTPSAPGNTATSRALPVRFACAAAVGQMRAKELTEPW
jgi:hypothetical protein